MTLCKQSYCHASMPRRCGLACDNIHINVSANVLQRVWLVLQYILLLQSEIHSTSTHCEIKMFNYMHKNKHLTAHVM